MYDVKAPAARFPELSGEGVATSLAIDNPTRVRSSLAAIAIASTVPAVVTTVLSISLALLLPSFVDGIIFGSSADIAATLPAKLFLAFLIATILPSAILVLSLHHIARALLRDRAWEYAFIGGFIAA